jgi:hypothetical protein
VGYPFALSSFERPALEARIISLRRGACREWALDPCVEEESMTRIWSAYTRRSSRPYSDFLLAAPAVHLEQRHGQASDSNGLLECAFNRSLTENSRTLVL